MARLRIDRELVDAAVLGGGVLGGGGGGSTEEGRRNGYLAVEFGQPDLVDPEDLPADGILVTASAVGSPASKTAFSLPVHYVRSVQLLMEEGGVDLEGIVTSECGGLAATNGWVQAAALGLPVVDAPCNGRAHPIALMGSIGLHKVADYESLQAVAGGNPAEGRYLEMFVRARLDRAAAMVLQAAVESGGMVAVARNPVTVGYARDNAAVGAIKRAVSVGRAMLEKQGPGIAMTEAAAEALNGEIVGRGRVASVTLETRGGLDVGTIQVRTGNSELLELTFWNEYMTLEALDPNGSSRSRRIATFPDLMATFDLSSGLPLSSAMVVEGQEVAVLRADRRQLILGAGMRDPELMRRVEETVGKEIVKFVFQQS